MERIDSVALADRVAAICIDYGDDDLASRIRVGLQNHITEYR